MESKADGIYFPKGWESLKVFSSHKLTTLKMSLKWAMNSFSTHKDRISELSKKNKMYRAHFYGNEVWYNDVFAGKAYYPLAESLFLPHTNASVKMEILGDAFDHVEGLLTQVRADQMQMDHELEKMEYAKSPDEMTTFDAMEDKLEKLKIVLLEVGKNYEEIEYCEKVADEQMDRVMQLKLEIEALTPALTPECVILSDATRQMQKMDDDDYDDQFEIEFELKMSLANPFIGED